METTTRIRGTVSKTCRGKPRQRSAIACQGCHSRRVKCDAAANGLPCANCQKTNQECRLIDSKRHRKRKKAEDAAAGRRDPVNPAGSKTANNATLSPSNPGSPPSHTGNGGEISESAIHDVDNGADASQSASNDGPESLYAQMLENSANSGRRRNPQRSAEQVMYLGETFNLTHLVRQTHPESRQHVHKHHYALPAEKRRRLEPAGDQHDDGVLEFLRFQGAFVTPPVEICHQLFHVYFTYFHPHYPILDRRVFANLYEDPLNPSSHLLLQAVLFTAVGHCDIPLLRAAGFSSRYDARLKLFKRAKALYDADYETDKVTIVQSLFLMSFWWNSPTDQKDTWHWLGTAISLAVTLGMHRSTSNSDLSVEQQRLWKKIWWSLFAEDKHAAAALGRPVHIHLKDCDVEPLTEADFEEEDLEAIDIFGRQEKVHILYVIFLSELSKVLERIIEKSFNAYDQTTSSRIHTLQSCEKLLQDWESRLPPELQLRGGGDDSNNPESPDSDTFLWTSMLHIAHSWFRILTHRSITLESALPTSQHPSSALARSSQRSATSAANQITRLIESLLSSSQITHCPIHIVPAAFAAMGMHAIDIRCGDALREQLGYVKIRIDMLALRELKSTWPVSGWIFLLFTRIVRKIREEGDGSGSAAAAAVLLGMQDEEPLGAAPGEVIEQQQQGHQQQHQQQQQQQQQRGHPVPGIEAENETHHMHNAGSSTMPEAVQGSVNAAAAAHHFQENIMSAAWEASNISMPLNFPATWNDALDEGLLYDPGMDFWMGMPQSDGAMYQ